MSQEFDGRHGTPQPSSNKTVRPDNGSMCALSVIINVVGVTAIILGFICAANFTKDYSGYWPRTNYALVVLYIAGGILSGIFSFALAVIVDACDKYRKSHKG